MVQTEGTTERSIATMAIVKVNFDHHHSFVGNFAPFVRHCLATSHSDAVSTIELQRCISDEFGLTLPQAVLKTLLRRAERDGHVHREQGTYHLDRDALNGCDLSSERAAALRKQNALVTAVADYASTKFRRKWSDQTARELLLGYLEAFSTAILGAAVAGRNLPREAQHATGDKYIIHRFVLEAAGEDPTSFEFLEAAVKGKMLADSVYLADSTLEQGVPALSAVEVYLDGPLLLYLLGYAGPELAAPYEELVDLLNKQGALVRCFTDSVVEARQILDAAAARVWTGESRERFYGDVVTYLIRAGKTRSDIELMSRRLESDLLRAGVQPVERPAPNARLTTDENRFEELLKNTIGYRNPQALKTDLDAVTAIHRLRRGQAARALPRSRAVFVTRNYGLFRTSAQFFRQRTTGPVVPNCVLDTAFTTLVWLHEPLAAPDLPRERIMADALAAMNPPDDVWEAYNDEIDRLRADARITEDDAHVLRLSEESSQALMDETLGDVEAYTEGTALQVLERAREATRADLEEAVAVERAARRDAESRLSSRDAVIQERARRIGEVAARGLFSVVLPLVVVGIVFGPLGPLTDAWSPLPGLVQVFCTTLALALTLWSFVEGITLRRLAERFARVVEDVSISAMRRLVGQQGEGE